MDYNNYNQGNNVQNPYSQPGGPTVNQMPGQAQTPVPGCGFAIASLIVGILSMTLCCVGGSIMGLMGLIFGIVSINKKESVRGMAIAGIVTSGIGILIGILVLVYIISLGAAVGNMSQDELRELRDRIYQELEDEGYDVPEEYKEYNQNDTNSGSSLLALPELPEKTGEHTGTCLLKHTAGDLHLMVELLHLQEV